MREAMSRFTQKKPHALLFGAVLAAIAQGSTVSSSIAISFVDVGMLSLAGSIIVMMGASIGGTFVTLLISLDIVGLSPLLLAVSFVMMRLRRTWAKKAGRVLHALSMILIGMFLMKLGVEPLLNNPAVREIVIGIASRPFTMFVAAVIGTSVLQSSASIMALAVTIAMSGVLPHNAVFPVALGSHLGSTVTMLLAAMGGRRNARILGVATFIYKLTGVALFAPFIPLANVFLHRLGFSMPANIVFAQTILVLFNAAIFYPWPRLLIHISSFILSHLRVTDLRTPVYLDDGLLDIPSLAVPLLTKEMIRLTGYMEALLQMQLCREEGNGLEKLLPDGIRDLTEACEQYMYAIQPPSIAEDSAAEREYRAISYVMLSLREASHIATSRIGAILEEQELDNLADKMGKMEWDKLVSCFMETVRDAFHAFSLGDADLALRAVERESEFENFTIILRSRLLAKETGTRKNSAVIDFIVVTRRFLHVALEIVRGGVFVDLMLPLGDNYRKAGKRFG
jgi:Na/Pi-cotransporter